MIANASPVTSVRIEEITSAFSPELLQSARQLLLEYGQFVASHPHAAQFCYGSLEKEAARLPFGYLEQGGGSAWALVNEKPVGFIAWRLAPGDLAKDSWEMKRLWVRPEGRGLGLGRRLTQEVLDRARAAERKAVYLDTIPAAMPDAVRLYRSMGFMPCSAYDGNPIEHIEYFVKAL